MKPEYIKEKQKKIVITHLSGDKPKEDVWAIVKRSRALINAICQYSKELKRKGVKVFERNVNIIHTEDGYYCAFYEEDLKKERSEPKEEKIKPFKGIDGRMKVRLTDKEGEEVIEDLAILVAKTWVDNPDGFEFVKFKDNNPENCDAKNLYWSETE